MKAEALSETDKLNANMHLSGPGEMYQNGKPSSVTASITSKDTSRTNITDVSSNYVEDGKTILLKDSLGYGGALKLPSSSSISSGLTEEGSTTSSSSDDYSLREKKLEKEQSLELVNSNVTSEDKRLFARRHDFYNDLNLGHHFLRKQGRLMDFLYLNDFLFSTDKVLNLKVDQWLLRQVRRIEDMYRLRGIASKGAVSAITPTLQDQSLQKQRKRLSVPLGFEAKHQDSESLLLSESQTLQADSSGYTSAPLETPKELALKSFKWNYAPKIHRSKTQASWFGDFIRDSFLRKRRKVKPSKDKNVGSEVASNTQQNDLNPCFSEGMETFMGIDESSPLDGSQKLDSAKPQLGRSRSSSSWFTLLKGPFSMGKKRMKNSLKKHYYKNEEYECKKEVAESSYRHSSITVIGLDNLEQTLSRDGIRANEEKKQDIVSPSAPAPITSISPVSASNTDLDNISMEEPGLLRARMPHERDLPDDAEAESDIEDEDDDYIESEEYPDLEPIQLPLLELEFGSSFMDEIEEELGILTGGELCADNDSTSAKVKRNNNFSLRRRHANLTKTKKSSKNSNDNSKHDESSSSGSRRNTKGKVKRAKSRELLKRVIARNVSKYKGQDHHPGEVLSSSHRLSTHLNDSPLCKKLHDTFDWETKYEKQQSATIGLCN